MFYQWHGVSLDELDKLILSDGSLVNGSAIVKLLEQNNDSVLGLKQGNNNKQCVQVAVASML